MRDAESGLESMARTAMVADLRADGTSVKVEPFSTPVCRMAVILDPEGNAVVLHHATTVW
ncbi:MAG: hypothetical protein HZB35_05790 [Nitrospirae bacterium]|nr:hypothetical protein [Nitrospirota bacterium]